MGPSRGVQGATPKAFGATLAGLLAQNADPGCYIGCYKVLLRVLHLQNRCESGNVIGPTENSEEPEVAM